MAHSVAFHPDAEAELLAARDWYAERSELAARGFDNEADLVIRRLLANPLQAPRHRGDTRRAVFPRFPFAAIYRVSAERIVIVAFAHQKRRPGYWRSRR